jgi:hypothetical protein
MTRSTPADPQNSLIFSTTLHSAASLSTHNIRHRTWSYNIWQHHRVYLLLINALVGNRYRKGSIKHSKRREYIRYAFFIPILKGLIAAESSEILPTTAFRTLSELFVYSDIISEADN